LNINIEDTAIIRQQEVARLRWEIEEAFSSFHLGGLHNKLTTKNKDIP